MVSIGTLSERFLMFGLGPSPRYRLSRPPLVEALAQVRFPVRAKLASLEGVAPIQERLDDGSGWSLVLSADSATLSGGPQYEEFGEFSDRFRRVLVALDEGGGVTRAIGSGFATSTSPRCPQPTPMSGDHGSDRT
jgi:hypothetical protein